jgi:RimJ/RimL family protein N-acetyltransferase
MSEIESTPWTMTINTERLILRPQQPDDYESWYAGFIGRLPKQHPYDEGKLDLDGCDLTWFSELCDRHQELAKKDWVYIFGIFERETGQHLGNIDLATIRRKDNQWANLGYGIHNQYQRRGYGREATQAAIISGFKDLNYHRIEAAINLDNSASIAFAESIGMKKEGIRRGFIYENEQWVDHLIYVAIPTDFGLEEKPPKEVLFSKFSRKN